MAKPTNTAKTTADASTIAAAPPVVPDEGIGTVPTVSAAALPGTGSNGSGNGEKVKRGPVGPSLRWNKDRRKALLRYIKSGHNSYSKLAAVIRQATEVEGSPFAGVPAEAVTANKIRLQYVTLRDAFKESGMETSFPKLERSDMAERSGIDVGELAAVLAEE